MEIMEQKFGLPITLGQIRIGVDYLAVFPTEKEEYINKMGKNYAHQVDDINDFEPPASLNPQEFQEFKRLQSLAITAIETAAMWTNKMTDLCSK